MLTPAYKLTIGQRIVDTTDEPKASTMVDLRSSSISIRRPTASRW